MSSVVTIVVNSDKCVFDFSILDYKWLHLQYGKSTQWQINGEVWYGKLNGLDIFACI